MAMARIAEKLDRFYPGFGGMGGGMGGGMALNQLLVVMDGIDEPPLVRKVLTNRLNTFLDAMFVIPTRIGSLRLRLRPPKPRPEQIYFIGACNVPIEVLDPALTRPGRMGRHIWFRTPTKDDRLDILDLYLGKVAHEPDLDTDRRRDELARITNGYSPSMIEQCCSMALTIAHTEGRREFAWRDIVEAMTTVETGTAQNIEYINEETRRWPSTRPATPPPGTSTWRRTCSPRGSRSANAADRSVTTRAWRRTSGSRISAAG